MNDLVYVMYNLKLKSKVIRKAITLPFDDIQSDDEWIVEERDNVDDGEENVDVEQEQPQGEGEGGGDGVNVQLDGGGSSSSNPTLDEFHLDKLVFDDDLSEHSSEENVDGDDENDDEDLGVGDDIIRGLDMDI
ncbi:hypothetical protein Fmac_003750 [Flemingia macrophylla]|uniref:Uncharacterized protein n=1 Tax=Flemingia macrophylla TaxID=520843 RepID=A0ABD1N2Y6_9FABA